MRKVVSPEQVEPVPTAIKPRRASDSVVRAYEALKTLVETYTLKPGERVNEIEVARKLGLSRTPVRQALARLGSEGYIEQTPNRGYYVRAISVRDIQDLYELRAIVEVGAFRLACERAVPDQVETMAAAWFGKVEQPEMSIDAIAGADEQFHRDIALLSGNSRIVETLDRINSLIGYFRKVNLDDGQGWRDDMLAEHSGLVDNLRARNADGGAAIMLAHVSISSEHAIQVTKESVARIFLNSDNVRSSSL